MNTSAFNYAIAKKFLSLSDSARARNKEFNLTLTSVRNLLNAKKCYYTGVPLDKETRNIDRVDNTKGYVIGNVVASHKDINGFKGNLDIPTILKIADKLKKRG